MSEEQEVLADLKKLSEVTLYGGFEYLRVMNNLLVADTEQALKECNAFKRRTGETDLNQTEYSEMGFRYRTLARSLMSYMEGVLYVMRGLIVSASDRGDVQLAAGEDSMIREKEYVFDARRKRIKERDRHNRFLDNFILTFQLAPRIFGSDYTIDYGGQGWQHLQRFVELRNALTHPKTPQDLLLPVDMPDTTKDAGTWFLECMRSLLASVDREALNRSARETVRHPHIREILHRRKSELS